MCHGKTLLYCMLWAFASPLGDTKIVNARVHWWKKRTRRNATYNSTKTFQSSDGFVIDVPQRQEAGVYRAMRYLFAAAVVIREHHGTCTCVKGFHEIHRMIKGWSMLQRKLTTQSLAASYLGGCETQIMAQVIRYRQRGIEAIHFHLISIQKENYSVLPLHTSIHFALTVFKQPFVFFFFSPVVWGWLDPWRWPTPFFFYLLLVTRTMPDLVNFGVP